MNYQLPPETSTVSDVLAHYGVRPASEEFYSLIDAVRKGVRFNHYSQLADVTPFSMLEWSRYLHLSERSIQRYRQEKKSFEAMQSERILQIALFYKRGLDVFGKKSTFDSWLGQECIALGRVAPKELLDSSFGVAILNDELTRIEHGVLA